MLREHSKHALSLYKTSTLKRRVERRLGIHSLDTMAAYEEFLRKNPEEFDLLFKEMLIGVTGFFRDAPVWQDLREALAPALPAPDSYTLQIFATDLNVDAIALARKGHYPARIAEVVSPERLARFFTAEGDGFR